MLAPAFAALLHKPSPPGELLPFDDPGIDGAPCNDTSCAASSTSRKHSVDAANAGLAPAELAWHAPQRNSTNSSRRDVANSSKSRSATLSVHVDYMTDVANMDPKWVVRKWYLARTHHVPCLARPC